MSDAPSRHDRKGVKRRRKRGDVAHVSTTVWLVVPLRSGEAGTFGCALTQAQQREAARRERIRERTREEFRAAVERARRRGEAPPDVWRSPCYCGRETSFVAAHVVSAGAQWSCGRVECDPFLGNAYRQVPE